MRRFVMLVIAAIVGWSVSAPLGRKFAPVFAAHHVLNGNGDMTGTHWVQESQPAQTLPPPEAWAAAERAIVRLEPAAFKNLPAAVREYLARRGCTIPQSIDVDENPHNVIRGRFTSSKQTDVAVLCSVRGTSVILVFRGGSASNVDELAPAEDKGFLQTIGDNKNRLSLQPRSTGV